MYIENIFNAWAVAVARRKNIFAVFQHDMKMVD